MLKPITSKCRNVARRVQRWGPAAVVHDLFYRGLRRTIGYRAFLGVVTPVQAFRYTEKDRLPYGYTASFITAEQLREHARDPLLDLSADFVSSFASRGDRCLGVYREGRLVSYSCYSRRPVPIDTTWSVSYDPRFAYVYMSFTVVGERGKRLHGLAMSIAARRFAEEDGCAGLIAYAESNQYASLRSGERMGHKRFGVVRIVDGLGFRRSWRSRGCDEYDFDVTVTPSDPAVTVA